MSNEIIAKLRSEGESERTDVEVVQEAADEIARLEQDLARFRRALEEIRDHPFEQSNSPRLIDQLWHFVRWSKATARTALERSKTNGKSARAEES
jgi:hypothetical protein